MCGVFVGAPLLRFSHIGQRSRLLWLLCAGTTLPLIASAKDDCAPKPFGTFHVFHLSVTKGAVPGFSLTIGDLAPIQMKLAADSPIDILANFPRGVKSISWPAISDSDGPDVEIDGQRERLGRGKLELSQDQRTAIINTEAEFGKTATTTPIVPPRIEVSLGFRPFQTGADPVFFQNWNRWY